MTAPTPNTVTVGNMIMGSATTFTIDGTDLGGTQGGVFLEKKETTVPFQVDQYIGDVAHGTKDATYTVKTELTEATLANLQIAWDNPTAPVVATTPASTTLSLDVNVGKKATHALVFVGPCPEQAGTTRTFTATVITLANSSHSYKKDGVTVFPVEFQVVPDLTKTSGRFGTIVDA